MKTKATYRIYIFFLLFIFSLLSTECQTTMTEVKVNSVSLTQEKDENNATVTFMRPSKDGFMRLSIWDSKNFVGILNTKNYVKYKTTPGEHFFMIRTARWYYIVANLEKAKNYYIVINFNQLKPIIPAQKGKTSERELLDWIIKGKRVAINPKAKLENFINPRKDHVQLSLEVFLCNYKRGSNLIKYEVLNPDDGW
ncbi:hypothetical protein ACFL27_24775 [candidate division CSSED10-310 bacterium]|uniref:DUF2846 domain-containing protein n=1 Tax=candidate division CSSED10-310 bacterium TaxID=2855610 RepID=A0ABV6Z4S8_UNCC1